MEITQIKYFLDVAETQHITESAEHLHIAQPALSQSIRRLEKDLGVPLFMHWGRNIVLTEYGECARDQLLPVIKKLDDLPDILRTMANISNETIHINVLAASSMVTDAVIEYKSRHENINFKLLQNTQGDIFDIEVTTKLADAKLSETENGCFECEEKIFLAVPSDGKFGSRSSIPLSEASDEGFISLFGSKQFRYICDRLCRSAGISPRIIFESDSPAAVKNMIAAHLGIGFWPEFTWGRLDSDRVKLIGIENSRGARDIVITRKNNKLNNDNVNDFFDFLVDFCKKRRAEAERT